MMSGWTPLMAAASGGSADCVAALLSAGADHAHSDRWGRTPLHLAASAGASALACAELLLHAGADAFVEDVKVRPGPLSDPDLFQTCRTLSDAIAMRRIPISHPAPVSGIHAVRPGAGE